MRTLLTTNDIKNIVNNIFNDNSEKITIENENGEQEQKNIKDYLNITFYNWKNRVVSENNNASVFEQWLDSLQYSFNKSYGLVEITNTEVVPSQDIDSATISGKITFLIQTNKINILDYYIAKIKNGLLGVPQDIQNSYGDIIKAYINFNTLDYDNEPMTIQYGECVIVSVQFKLTYLNEALTYNDTPMYMSFDNGISYQQIPYTKSTWQNIYTGQNLTSQNTPNRVGIVNTSLTQVKTITFYDFNANLNIAINNLFWKQSCYAYKESGGSYTLNQNVSTNQNVIIKVVYNGTEYYFKDTIKSMEKDFTNSDFTITSITLQGSALN